MKSLLKNAFAYFIKEARLAMPVLVISKIKLPRPTLNECETLTSKEGGLVSCFDKIKENETNDTLLKQALSNNHTVAANKEKTCSQLALEQFFGFFTTFTKTTKHLGVHLTFKLAHVQDIFYTSLVNDITVTTK